MASNHHLVFVKMKLRLNKHWTTGKTSSRRFDTVFLRDTDKLNQFMMPLNNRLQALEVLLKGDETLLEGNYKGIKKH